MYYLDPDLFDNSPLVPVGAPTLLRKKKVAANLNLGAAIVPSNVSGTTTTASNSTVVATTSTKGSAFKLLYAGTTWATV